LADVSQLHLESIQAVLRAAVLEKSPVIVQISMGARKYVGDVRILLPNTFIMSLLQKE
jgi:fructose/tagatose bisphosphate aldolase